MPRTKTAEERKRRDALILRMYLAGHTMSAIAEHQEVDVSRPMVSKILARRLREDTENLGELADQAFPMYMQQLDMLLSASFPKAMRGDLKAAEHCRRVLAQKASANGWGKLRLGGAMEPPPEDNESLDEFGDDGPLDDGVVIPEARLEEFRRRYGG